MKKKWKEKLVWSWADTGRMLLIMVGAIGVTFFLFALDEGEKNASIFASMIFVLAVMLVSRMTTGYLYGTLASIVAVILVNYAFTYPYFEFNFTISGYPLTFITMMAVSLITSTMTTQIKEHEKIRLETEKEKMRANLLRAVSHDLRTPLTSIVGSTSAILDNDGKLSREEEIRLLQEAREDAEWLVRMVENLLSVTKINAGNAKIKMETEVVEEIVAEGVQKFKKHFPDQRVVVQVPEEFLMVQMDAILIEQVLNNLLENAVLHSGSREQIELSVQRQDMQVIFRVRDHGKGIPEQEKEAIFQGYFYGREEEGSDRKKNMGIGLSVCMTIIKAHQGDMWAENAADGGAVFYFSLPLAEEGVIE